MNRPATLLALALSVGFLVASDANAQSRRRAVVDLTVQPRTSYLQTPKVYMPGEVGRMDTASWAGVYNYNGDLAGMPSVITSQTSIVRPDMYRAGRGFPISW